MTRSLIKIPILLAFIGFWSPQTLGVPKELEDKFGPRPLDGVYIESVEIYSIPKAKSIGFSFGLWPVQPYYNGFSLNVDFTSYLSKNLAWELLNVSYLYNVQTSLTSDLAENYAVNPQEIEKSNFILGSNLRSTIAYGKFVFFGDYIRYFRSSIIFGPAVISTVSSASKTRFGLTLGWGFETFLKDSLSWRFEIKDVYAIGAAYPNNLAFTLGTTYGF